MFTNALIPMLTVSLLTQPAPAERATPEKIPADDRVRLLAHAVIPAATNDNSGLTGTMSDGQPRARLGGFGSGLAYTGVGDRFIALPDRGPQDGAVDFDCRWQELDLTLTPKKDPSTRPYDLTVSIGRTVLLQNQTARRFVGLSRAIDDGTSPLRLDPEGIRVSKTGESVFVSDEYGPTITEFTRDGVAIRSIAVPPIFAIAKPSADADSEITANAAGRVANRGFEGLAISPDGSTLTALLQSPLIQDGGRKGLNCRVLQIDLASGTSRQLVYPLSDASLGTNEILAISATTFLVIERDGKDGAKSKAKRIYRADFTDATDVSNIPSLPADTLPAGVVPAKKTLILDMLDPAFGLRSAEFPEKIEALCFGPTLPNGSVVLYIVSDNDFRKDQDTHFWAFAIPASALRGDAAQIVAPPTKVNAESR